MVWYKYGQMTLKFPIVRQNVSNGETDDFGSEFHFDFQC